VGNVALVTAVGPELDAARAQVVERGLTADAVGRLVELVSGFSLEALAPVKQQLKRFFSAEPWTERDDQTLADAIGEGTGSGRDELAPGLVLQWRFEDSRFELRVLSSAVEDLRPRREMPDDDADARADLGGTFDGVVVPEATPSPRTIRFATPPLHRGPSRVYDSRARDEDPRVARLFDGFDVTNVLVGPDFVAVTIARPDRWEAILGSMLRAVTAEFTGEDPVPIQHDGAAATRTSGIDATDEDERTPRHLQRAWAELGHLRGERPEDLELILAAGGNAETAGRQVAAALLVDAPPDAAASAWQQLITDHSRAVRRSAVDAVAGAAREELRPLLEHALGDTDAWTRWKALRGLDAIGTKPSRGAIEALAGDADFRVRLEAARALAG
jgi:hypothetical protein